MTTMHASTFAPRLRPLAAVLTTLCAAATAALKLPTAHASALPSPHVPMFRVVSNCNDNGAGSLRDAVNNAVSGDIVDLTHLSCSTISLTTGALVFGQFNLNIIGPGQNKLAIDGRNSSAVLYHLGNGTLSVSGLSIINGHKYRSDGNAAGACVHANSDLDLDNVNIRHCKASGETSSVASRSASGGAVWVQGKANMVRSTISDSSAVAKDTGYAGGGGLYVLGGLSMIGSTITGNVAAGHVLANSFGGGVFARGPVNIFGSTISANQAQYVGGLELDDRNGHSATLTNSTVSGNTAKAIGGVYARPSLSFYNSTIAFNTSSVWTGDNGQHYAAGVHVLLAGQMHSTIISNNVNTDPSAPSPSADLTGATSVLLAGGHNNVMFCDTTCPDDTTNEDPGLHPLQDNGGPTRTHLPTPGPWHRFGGSNERNLLFDQRGLGFPRESAGDPIEIGALQSNSDIVFVNGFN